MKYTGFTLIELIVTLAVISVLLTMGIPQFQSMSANSRLTTVINSLTGDLAFARTEAIKRGTTTTVTATNVSDWATAGWITAVNISGTETQLRISPALSGTTTFTSSSTSVTFNADGRSSSTVTFVLCDERSGNHGKKITLNTTGQSFLETKQSCNP